MRQAICEPTIDRSVDLAGASYSLRNTCDRTREEHTLKIFRTKFNLVVKSSSFSDYFLRRRNVCFAPFLIRVVFEWDNVLFISPGRSIRT